MGLSLKKIKSDLKSLLKRPSGKIYFLVLLCAFIAMLYVTCYPKVRRYIDEKKTLETYQEYAKEDKPIFHVVMLDNSASMQTNFRNMDRQPLDCMLIFQSILQERDHLVIFPLMNGGEKYIEVTGTDDYRQGQERINGISLYQQEGDEDVTAWAKQVKKYVDGIEDAYIRVHVITDKQAEEINELRVLDGEKYPISIYATALNNYYEADDHYLGYSIIDGSDLMSCMFSGEFYITYYGYQEDEYDSEKEGTLEYNLPEETNKVAVIVEGEESCLWRISSFSLGKEKIQGTLLADNRCLYKYENDEAEDYIYFNPNGKGKVYILYPTSNGQTAAPAHIFTDDGFEYIFHTLFIVLAFPLVIYLIKQFFGWDKKKKIFISYRRDGGHGTSTLAHGIAERFRKEKYSVFLDTESLKGGTFNDRLMEEIEKSSCIVAILPPNGLKGCMYNRDDWVRRELAHALYHGIPIVPVFLPGFELPKQLPLDIAGLKFCNAVNFDDKNYYLESMDKVVEFVEYAVENYDGEQEEDIFVEFSEKEKESTSRFLKMLRLDEDDDFDYESLLDDEE